MAVQPTLVVCSDIESGVDRDFFLSLGAKVVFLEGPNALLAYLRQSRPHGVCLVMPPTALAAKTSWFHSIERRCYFEGLRVAIFLRMTGSQITLNDLLGSERGASLRMRLSSLLAMRDVVLLGRTILPAERDELRQRVCLSLGLPMQQKFEDRFPFLLRKGGAVQIQLPGRVSWFDDEGLINIETSVRMTRNTGCKIYFAQLNTGLVACDAICVEGTQTDLRFNFGSAVKLALGTRETTLLRRIFAAENPKVMSRGRAFRRALTVVRSPAMRDSVAQLMHAGMVEFRVPLVWRNVLLDIPKLSPHYVVIEDSVLSAQAEKAHSVLSELRRVAGTSTKICLIGPTAPLLSDGIDDSNLLGFSTFVEFDAAFRSILADAARLTASGNESSRTWLSADSSLAECTIELEDRYVMASSSGIVIESCHTYRSLSNLFVGFPGTDFPRALVKNVGSYLTTDGWKVPKTGGRTTDAVPSRFHLQFLSAAHDFTRDLEAALQAELDILREHGGLSGQKHFAMGKSNAAAALAAAAAAAVAAQTVPRSEMAGKEEEGRDTADVEQVSSSEVESLERGFAPGELEVLNREQAEARRQRKLMRAAKQKRDRLILMFVLLGVSILIAAIIYYLPSNSADFSDSFDGLFRRYGRGE